MLSLSTITITALAALTVPASTEPEDGGSRGRQLSLLSIFSFPNSECVGGLEGTRGECYTASECHARGGTSQSTCASGIGVCCYVVQESCLTDTEVTYNNTYIRNIGYPGSYSTGGTCSHKIKPSHDNICQFRLDFQKLDLAKPNNIDGECETDSITFTEVGGEGRGGQCKSPGYRDSPARTILQCSVVWELDSTST